MPILRIKLIDPPIVLPNLSHKHNNKHCRYDIKPNITNNWPPFMLILYQIDHLFFEIFIDDFEISFYSKFVVFCIIEIDVKGVILFE